MSNPRETPGGIGALDASLNLLARLSRAATTRAIYPRAHPAVGSGVDEMLHSLGECLDKRGEDSLTFLIIDREVILDDRPLRLHNMHLLPFVRLLDRLGIQRLTLNRGLDREETHRLLSALAGGRAAESSTHVLIGRIEVGAGDGTAGTTSSGGGTLSEEDLERGSHAFAGLRADRQGSIEQLDQLVWRVMEGLASTSRSLLLLAPVKTFSERLFLHSVNVSSLAVAQARSLGIDGTALHGIGLGALLHDVGKLALPETLWTRPGRLDDGEWELVQLHPELGAAMLCGCEGVPPLAVLVAYEHHLRWDGRPSFPRCRRPPTLASRITAVADTWDVLATETGDLVAARPNALKVWRERAGTLLDPLLVGNFLLMMAEIGEGPA